ncbi:hypothetical protein N0V83_004766 [Neocucurbitaria cava]|uniref:DUF7923 domain-containing protein n=1 Tax=Neocucurbitaria cava TaxID=798079 RepID=A0A9W8Y9S6_9PLEO|nr:hypothetical protein N0V83_004766 [Neocucurbitaria cava]
MDHEVDLLGFDDGFSAVRMSGASALQDLEAAAESCRRVMKQSQEEYDELLAKYDALRSRRDGGEVSQGAATEERAADAYVVVLIDAHSHKFKTNLMHGAESGGSHTAKLLKKAASDLQSYIPIEIPTVSSPNFPRALGGFAAGFSREEVFFDFVDVVDEETVERKITGLFQLYVKDPQCKQVLLGASGSMSYLRVLEAHQVFAKKITLIQRGVEDTSLMRLGLNSVTFPQVFESLSDGNSTKRTSSGNRSFDSNVSHWIEEPEEGTTEETTGPEDFTNHGQSSKESVTEWTTPTGVLIDI